METSNLEIDLGRKSSRVSLLNNDRQPPSETSHDLRLGSSPGVGSYQDVRVPVHAEKYRSHRRSVVRHATLKLDRAQGSKVPWRQEHHLFVDIEANSEEQSIQLPERQPRKNAQYPK